MNAIGDICERTFCRKVLFYVVSIFLWFGLNKCFCTIQHDILNIEVRCDRNIFHAELVNQGCFILSQKLVYQPPNFCDLFQRRSVVVFMSVMCI